MNILFLCPQNAIQTQFSVMASTSTFSTTLQSFFAYLMINNEIPTFSFLMKYIFPAPV